MIECERITDPAALHALQPEWTELWERCPDATPFQTPDWLLPWWDSFGSGQLTSLAVRSAGTLKAVIPAYLDGGVLRLAGGGVSDYLDALIDPDLRGGAWEWIESLDWERCEFTDLPPGSPLLDGSADSLDACVADCSVCPSVPLPPPKTPFGRNLRRYGPRIGQFESTSATTLDGFFDALFRLHTARWNERGSGGVLAGDALQTFHRRAARNLLEHGRLLLDGLRRDGELVGVIYGLLGHQRVWLYISGFDPAFAKLSPGGVMVAHVLERAVAEGYSELDFLRGNEPYKYTWGARDRKTFSITARRRVAPNMPQR